MLIKFFLVLSVVMALSAAIYATFILEMRQGPTAEEWAAPNAIGEARPE